MFFLYVYIGICGPERFLLAAILSFYEHKNGYVDLKVLPESPLTLG